MSRVAEARGRRRRTALVVVVVIVFGAVAAGVAYLMTPHVLRSVAEAERAEAIDYPGDPEAEARLVAGEQRRLIDTQSMIDAAESLGLAPASPYRLDTTPTTIVLPARSAAYTLDELSQLSPSSIVAEEAGRYLITENVFIGEGATLRLTDRVPLTVKLASDAESFVSIVALGGNLEVIGADGSATTTVTSWDSSSGAADTLTDDGRAYVRVIGGHADLSEAVFSDLGFWSGVTGGVSLTGTVLPAEEDGLEVADSPEDAAQAQAAEETEGVPQPLAEGPQLQTLSVGSEEKDRYVSASVSSVVFERNAFGVFVTNADRVHISNSQVRDNLIDGLVLQRGVSNSTVESTTASGNAADGFALLRATTSVVFERLTATDNGRTGIYVEGRPLVDGPSATGIPVTVYGANEVRSSVSRDNGRYGIEVVGGQDIVVQDNSVSGNEMGIVVSEGASAVTVKNNEVRDSAKQGIAVRDSGLDMVLVDNVVDGADIGIYLRDAGGEIERNEVSGVGNHGITLVSDTGSTTIVENTVSGSGPSAIDTARTDGVAVRNNLTEDWTDTKPLWVTLRAIFQPLTILWVTIFAVLLLMAIAYGRRPRVIRHPYADQVVSLSALTGGVVSRDQLRRSDA